MIDDIAVVTYTNSKCRDVWPMYLGQHELHCSRVKNYVFSDVGEQESFPKHEFLVYDNADPYHVQWTKCLDDVKENYVVYAQEDFILYSDVDYDALSRYKEFLDGSTYDFVRLIRSGFDNSLKHVIEDLYAVDENTDDIFQQQVTLWKKNSLKNLYDVTKSEKWLEGPHWRQVARSLGIRGVFAYNGESKRGKYHCDSRVWPYVCTAVSRGKWNVLEYGRELGLLFERYSVDPRDRGTRTDYNYIK